MNTIYIQQRIFKAAFITFFLLLGANARCQDGLTVICNNMGTPDAMKLSELKSVMIGEKQRWKSGEKVTIALMKMKTQTGKNTARVIFNMSANELQKFTMGQSYQGNTTHPKFFDNTTQLIEFVAENPGAIGVIDQPAEKTDVKIIKIDGKTQLSILMIMQFSEALALASL